MVASGICGLDLAFDDVAAGSVCRVNVVAVVIGQGFVGQVASVEPFLGQFFRPTGPGECGADKSGAIGGFPVLVIRLAKAVPFFAVGSGDSSGASLPVGGGVASVMLPLR
jgi:hypothetical protein